MGSQCLIHVGRLLYRHSSWQIGKQLPYSCINTRCLSTATNCRSLCLDIDKKCSSGHVACKPCTSVNYDNTSCWVIQCRGMAGHSHWHNIQHSKGAADAKFMNVITGYIRMMKVAITDGGPNPATNKKLDIILEKMKNANIAKADIKRYLENATKKATTAKTIYLEIRGPLGTLFVLEVETDNFKACRDELNNLMKKVQGRISDTPSYHNYFETKGVVTVPVTKDMQIANMDEYLEIAIETGAEDVILTKNDVVEVGDPEFVLKFHCDPKTVRKVTKDIEELYNLEYSTSQVEFFPHNWVTIDNKDDIEACQKIANKLQSHTDFVNLFDNISLPDD